MSCVVQFARGARMLLGSKESRAPSLPCPPRRRKRRSASLHLVEAESLSSILPRRSRGCQSLTSKQSTKPLSDNDLRQAAKPSGAKSGAVDAEADVTALARALLELPEEDRQRLLKLLETDDRGNEGARGSRRIPISS